jgi:hypothetical protein
MDRQLLTLGLVSSSNNQSPVGLSDFEVQIPKPTEIAPFRLDPMLCFVDQPGTLSDKGTSPNPVSCSDVLSSTEPKMALQSGHSHTSWAAHLVAEDHGIMAWPATPPAIYGGAPVAVAVDTSCPQSDEPPASPTIRNMSPAIVSSPAVQPVTIQEFITGLKLPLEQPLIQSSPCFCASRVPVDLVPRRSDRLAAKSVYRDPNLKK